MAHSVIQMRRFARQYKKLNDNVAKDVDKAVDQIANQPSLGEKKKGELADLRVYKFKSKSQLFLLGYSVNNLSLIHI